MADGPAHVFCLAGLAAWTLPQSCNAGQAPIRLSKFAAKIPSGSAYARRCALEIRSTSSWPNFSTWPVPFCP